MSLELSGKAAGALMLSQKTCLKNMYTVTTRNWLGTKAYYFYALSYPFALDLPAKGFFYLRRKKLCQKQTTKMHRRTVKGN